jgi:HEAT repeat protein
MALCDAALRDEDPGVRRNAVAGFANYRSEARCAVDELLKGVECESWRDRTYAAVALALIGTPKCREAVAATAGRARKASAENRIEVAKVVRTLDAEWMAVIVPQLCDAVGAEIASLDREAAKREKAEGG